MHGRLFLSPECPLCRDYAVRLRALHATWASDSVAFVGVVPGRWYSADEVRRYRTRFGLPFPILLDPNGAFTAATGARVTPEAFVFRNAERIYRGAIDDWAVALTRKKLEATEHYLADALHAWRTGSPVPNPETEPVGCLIE